MKLIYFSCSQVDYYGSSAAEFNKQINVSRNAHTIKDGDYFSEVDENLTKIKSLKIVNL